MMLANYLLDRIATADKCMIFIYVLVIAVINPIGLLPL